MPIQGRNDECAGEGGGPLAPLQELFAAGGNGAASLRGCAPIDGLDSCIPYLSFCFDQSRGTTLNALVEVADLKALHERFAAGGSSTALRGCAPIKAAAELKQDVFDHEIVLTAALNQVGAGSHVRMLVQHASRHAEICIRRRSVQQSI